MTFELLLHRAVRATPLLLGMHGLASAAITTEHATVCRAAGDQPYAGLYLDDRGATNDSGGLLEVVCPIDRTQSVPVQGLTVWLDGFVPAGTSMNCTMFSADGTGIVGSSFFHIAGPSRFDQPFYLPAAQVDDSSSQFMVCVMPPGAELFDLEPVFSIY